MTQWFGGRPEGWYAFDKHGNGGPIRKHRLAARWDYFSRGWWLP